MKICIRSFVCSCFFAFGNSVFNHVETGRMPLFGASFFSYNRYANEIHPAAIHSSINSG